MTSSISIKWDNPEKTILRYTFHGNWNWDDYLAELTIGRKMMAEVEHTVCILNDMTAMGMLPPNFISTARNVITSRPKNTGLAIFLTTNTFFKAMYRVISRLLEEVPTRYVLVTTEEEAYQKINDWLDEQSTSSEN